MKISEVKGNVTILGKDDNAMSFLKKRNRKSYNAIPVHVKIVELLMGNAMPLGLMCVRLQRKRMEISRSLNILEKNGTVCRVLVGRTFYFILTEDFRKWWKIQ